ncbi:hypothetical protein IQ266_25400 [filamentous cyanobacterium LEGE 11480]|uniref:Uncharacterized protein n=1 Tax=Romeriopsis navalis LEGE 11480 TaxID=2777977 RepID=A0A928Z6W7_9CYAN|nr:hypothetical protein [Romeriopsis navalis]MBE9033078.1 hypothetical protein [Romeriopsis navalis LEGE 11480]
MATQKEILGHLLSYVSNEIFAQPTYRPSPILDAAASGKTAPGITPTNHSHDPQTTPQSLNSLTRSRQHSMLVCI